MIKIISEINMKNPMYVLFVSVFTLLALGFGVNSASAGNCASGEVFNTNTGLRCTVWLEGPVSGTSGSGGLSSGGGSSEDGGSAVSTFNSVYKSSFKVGTRSNDVKVLQQFLKDEGYYYGRVDGKYGRITDRAVKDFQEDNDVVVVPPTLGNSPVISGVSGPQSLEVYEQGTWSIKAYSGTGGNLSYSVVWGDEAYTSYFQGESLIKPVPGQSATFTHNYSQAGTYNPTFIVTSENTINCITTPCPSNAGSAKTSLSVKVGDSSSKNNSPVLGPIAIPGSISVGQPTNFNFNAGDADGDDLSWSIGWGDNVAESGRCPVNPVTGTGQNWNYSTSHIWNGPGNYTVNVSVSDCKGGTASTSFTVYVGNLTSNSITVTSPNGGETWIKGTVQQITWKDKNDISTHEIKLVPYYPPCTGEVCPMQLSMPYINYTIANVQGSSYNWTVGKVWNTDGIDTAPEGSYTIQVCQTGTTNCDSSDSYFKITSDMIIVLPPPSTLTVSTPSILPSGRVGQAYSVDVDAYGDEGPYSWGFSNFSPSDLPPGLSSGGGMFGGRPQYGIAGVPTTPGVYSFTLVLGSKNQSTTKRFTISIY